MPTAKTDRGTPQEATGSFLRDSQVFNLASST